MKRHQNTETETARDALCTLPTVPFHTNRLHPGDEAVHDWYRFVLSFPPHLVRHYVERFDLVPGSVVLDPFCGTGTTLVECRKLGLNAIGVESNPLAAFASNVKTDWSPDPARFTAHARGIARRTALKLRNGGVPEDSAQLLFGGTNSGGDLRELPEPSQRLLLKGSISPLPLHKVLVLLEAIERARDTRFQNHEKLCLAKTALRASNLRFGPEVGVGLRKENAPVVDIWLNQVLKMARDLRELPSRNGTTSSVCEADARRLEGIIPPDSVDAVITSPPYPNEKDYTRTTRLESVLLGFVRNRQEMQSVKRMLISSNTRCAYKDEDDDRYVADIPAIQQVAQEIERRRIQLGKTSGFERLYARVTRLYFGGMARHLAELRTLLKPGAQLAYVVGDQASFLRIMIRTGTLLAEVAARLGYEVTGIDLFRTRMATATGEQLREEVVILRWPGGNPTRRSE